MHFYFFFFITLTLLKFNIEKIEKSLSRIQKAKRLQAFGCLLYEQVNVDFFKMESKSPTPVLERHSYGVVMRRNKYNLTTDSEGRFFRLCPKCGAKIVYSCRQAASEGAKHGTLCMACPPIHSAGRPRGYQCATQKVIRLELSDTEYQLVITGSLFPTFNARFSRLTLVCPLCGEPRQMNYPSDWLKVGWTCSQCHQRSVVNV